MRESEGGRTYQFFVAFSLELNELIWPERERERMKERFDMEFLLSLTLLITDREGREGVSASEGVFVSFLVFNFSNSMTGF